MKRVLLAISLLPLAFSLTQAQEAFYIYRNDGDFNGFFYDEVVEMRQSKIGVDSIEYDKWVTQEVVLEDTIYRIPLAAIDSIGFQQPEIKFNPELRHMDLLGITPYVTSRNGQTLTFSNELPANLMPQVGNVLFGMEGVFEEENFGGRVTSVRNEGDDIIVETDKLTKMSDVFVQFITIEEVGVASDDPNQMRHRMAGMNKIKEWNGSYSINTLNINNTLHFPITGGGAVSGSIDAGTYLKSRLVVTYQINGDDYLIKCATHDEIGLQAGFTIQAEVSKHEETEPLIPKPFATFKYPATLPLFEYTPVPQLGYHYGGNFAARVTFPNVAYRAHLTFTFDSDLPNLMKYAFFDEFVTPEAEGIFDALTGMDAEVKLEGYYQMGIREEVALKTNSVFSSIIAASTGVDIWVGPKIDGSLNVDAKAFWTTDDGPYIFRDSHVGISVISLDMEAYSEIDNMYMEEPIHKTWATTSIDLVNRLDLYAFPKFERFDASVDESTGIVHAAWKAEPRVILWPCIPGIVMYRLVKGETDIVASGHDIAPKFGYTMKENYDVNFNTNHLKAGDYKVAPSLLISDTDFPVRSMAKVVSVPPTLEISPTHFDVQASGEPITLTITSNTEMGFEFIHKAGDVGCSVYHDSVTYELDTIDLNRGIYQQTFYVDPDNSIFGWGPITGTWAVRANGASSDMEREFTITQDLMSLANTEMTINIGRRKELSETSRQYGTYNMTFSKNEVQASRIDSTHILVAGRKTEDGKTCTVSLTIEYIPGENQYTAGTENVSGTIHCTGDELSVDLTFNQSDGNRGWIGGYTGTSNDRTDYDVFIYYNGYPH